MTTELKTLRWRLRVMMAERNITTVTELGRRLKAAGVPMSSQQLTRVVAEMPQRLNTELLAALLTVLDCRVEDLIQVQDPVEPSSADRSPGSGMAVPNQGNGAPPRTRAPRKRMPKPELEPVDDITGPSVAPFPITPRR